MSQIEEMSKKLATVSDEQKSVNDKYKVKIQEYQNEVDLRELEITRLSTILKEKTALLNIKEREESADKGRRNDVEDELELKSGENNRLRR